MKIKHLPFCCLLGIFLTSCLQAQTLAEIKLIAPLEENRGWCIDMFAHLANALPLAGYQGHTCFSYMGSGPTEDQGFYIEGIKEKAEFRNAYFDQCMTLYEPNPGSFIASEPCNGEPAQQIELKANGQIVPKQAQELCLTLGSRSVAGGGSVPLHLVRKVSFESCDDLIADRQRWELRSDWDGLDENTTADRPFADNPNAKMPGQ